jgi:hypothetical protein
MPHFTHLFKGDILYPKQHALAGDCWGHDEETNPHRWVTFCPDFPHLFRHLKWWEGLAIDELPKYVKWQTTKFVANVEYKEIYGILYAKNVLSDNWHNIKGYSEGTEPATEAEYQEYLTKLNGE